jgi:hypothetical protein
VQEKANAATHELAKIWSRILDEEGVQEPMRTHLTKGVDSLLGQATKVIAHPSIDLKLARVFDRLAAETFRFSEAVVVRELGN